MKGVKVNNKESSFSKRLKEAIKKSGKTQKMISEETGISPATISQYLSDKYKPKNENLNILAKALNVSQLWLEGKQVTCNRIKNITRKDIEKNKDYIMNDDEIYDMEFREVKFEFEEKVSKLNDNAVYNLVDKIEYLATIDDKDWELLILFNQIVEDAKEKVLDYTRILNQIPEFLNKCDSE